MKRETIVNKIFFISMSLVFCLLSCSNGLNEVYEKQEGYRVIYKADTISGGELPEDPNYYKEGDTVTVLKSSSDTAGNLYYIDGNMGYRCSAWVDRDNTYTEGSTFIMGDSDVTLIAQWTPYGIGDEGPGKGVIIYDNGSYASGWRYLESAPSLWYDSNSDGIADMSDADMTFQFWTNLVAITGSYSSTIGDGLANTNILLTNYSFDAVAAFVCVYNCHVGGKTDWYLPSRDELIVMLSNYSITGMMTGPTIYYWSSYAVTATTDAYICYYNGSPVNLPNAFTNYCYVRPIRRF